MLLILENLCSISFFSIVFILSYFLYLENSLQFRLIFLQISSADIRIPRFIKTIIDKTTINKKLFIAGLQCEDLITAILHESLDVKCWLTRTNAKDVTWSVGGVPIGADDPRYSIEKKQPSNGELGYVLLRVHNVTEYQARAAAVSLEEDNKEFTKKCFINLLSLSLLLSFARLSCRFVCLVVNK